MIIITGGACQGKRDYALERFGFAPQDVHYCSQESLPDFSKPCLCGLHLYLLGALERGEDPVEYIQANLEALKDSVILCDDICSGIVPITPQERRWRDAAGRVMQLLCREAQEVTRLFCGIPQTIKG